MAELQPLSFTVDPSNDLLDLAQEAIVGAITALDDIDGVSFAGAAGQPGPRIRRYEGGLTHVDGSAVRVTITTELTNPPTAEPT